ncbi:TRAP-type C4-dicarboxylate transport system substrate-binding protein [Chromohalobacter marismortui]|uniref:TRAP-type C4-dicarboxylate transport system substrate-binding protein n=1 Tax=Chromohalobacter marismortui TaxID=42055 RepID=A0A4R7NML3_9GAMM|nr:MULTISPECIES: TRAP transporter substrate-binding protein [Chromohalobacter]MCI0509685.1 TRAP transporter substrate-binding protein [Chromohalobacter sp.]MCI0593352.1 TRAP transporter substrate-binding protein [Chromohalobacter sp.]TDU21907.1 TRAP-type C4-dicarboxylate transport system substrate-binding protein [Chromohalobacter marismortui]
MKTLKNRTLLTLTAGVAMALSAGANAVETLKLAHFVAPAHVVNSAIVYPLKEGVEEQTNGELKINVYPGGELGSGPKEQYPRVLQGVADIVWGIPGYTSSQFKKSMVVEMPGAIPEGMHGYEMLWNAYDEHLKSEFPGTKPLALWTSEPSIFIMKDKEIHNPADLEGLKIRVSGEMTAALIDAYGGTPVQMPAGEVYNALQTGLIDGLVTGASAVNDFKLDEVANVYSVGAPLGHIMFYLAMNQKKYASLSPEFQQAIDDNSGMKLSRSGEQGWNERANETLKALREDPDNTVIELSDKEIAKFEAIADTFRKQRLADKGTEDVLNAMRGE